VSKTENIEQLERQLATFVSVKDDAGVRRIYRELLEAGRSRAEVTAMLLRASSRPELSEGTSAEQKPGPAGGTRSDMNPPAENISGSGPFAEADVSAPILLDSYRGAAVQGCSRKGDDAHLCINESGLKIDPPHSKILRRFMLPTLIILVASLGFFLRGADQSHSGPAAFSIIPTTGPSELEVAERDHWSEPVSIAAAANRAVSPASGKISPGGNWKSEADEPARAAGVVPVPSSAPPQRNARPRRSAWDNAPVHANARPRPTPSNKNGHVFPSHIPRYSVWYYGHTLPTRHYALSYEGYMTARSTGWSGGQFGPAPYSASGQ
jgi:hypothetical protein